MAAELTVFWHPAVLAHDTGSGLWEAPPSELLAIQELHPENAERVENMRSVLAKGPLAPRLSWRDGRLAEPAELDAVHEGDYIPRIRELCEGGGRPVSATTLASA